MEGEHKDIIEKTCITVRHSDIMRKKQMGVTWRLIVRYGLKHLETCIPREEFINENYDRVRRSSEYAKIVHKLRNEFPKVWDAIVLEKKGEVNASTQQRIHG